ncbi:MAG: hypothetical protein IJC74_00070 [Clostridia bacterium]|nr:hypothetical protein [Clostridia bacterium]
MFCSILLAFSIVPVIGNTTFAAEEDDVEDEIIYLKGNDDYLSLEAYDIPEGSPGSFYTEAENGITSDGIMNVIEDVDASGEKGIAAPPGGSRSDAEAIKNVDARYRFNVTSPGLYKVYIRMKTPAKTQKSTHFAFDDNKYRRVDYSTTIGDYTWFTSNSNDRYMKNPNYSYFTAAYLDEGVHILNAKARQNGHIIDCILITKQSWTPAGFGSLPGEPYRHTKNEMEIIEYENSRSKLIIDGNKWLTDVSFNKVGGDFMVPMRNLMNIMGVEVKIRDDHYLAFYDRNYIKIYINSNEAIVNGQEIKMTKESYLYEDNILMVPLSALQQAFDFEYKFEENVNTLNITTHFLNEANIRKESNEILEVDPYLYGANFKLKIDRPNAKVKIWLKRRLDSFYEGQWQEYTREKFKGGWKGNGGSKMDYYWGQIFTPVYENGYFKGDCGSLYRGSGYDMKVSVIDGDYTDTFIIEKAIQTLPLSFREYTEDEDWLVTGGKLIAIPTFENISFYIDEADPETTCNVMFREQGTAEWRNAYKPFFDTRVTGGQYRGSIVYLKEDTNYEIKAEIKKNGNVIRTETTSCRTWKSDVPVAKTIDISEIYTNGKNEPLALINIKGSEDGWIKIKGDGKTVIDAGHEWKQSVYLSDCKYVILEGLTVKGGDKFGINIARGCENIRVINCDVSGWGATGVLNPWLKGYIIDGNIRNLDGGIRIWNAKNVVVERCYIHDSIGSTNPWKFGDTSTFADYWIRQHPAGTCGMLLGGSQGLVIRYNDMSGSDQHRFNDVMECEINGGNYAGPGFDSDIYGNLWYCSEDDSFEVDSSGRNVRVYENRSEQTLCGVSTAPTNLGPLYIYRNLFTNRGTSQNENDNPSIKIDGGEGMQFIFNNTMSTEIRSSGVFLHGLSRNNITLQARNGGGGEEEIADYDIVTGQDKKPSPEYEPHGFFDQPKYENSQFGDYRLAKGSLGIDQGEHLDNFSDVAIGGTDIGAFEKGGKYNFFPYRPVDASADKYFVKIDNNKEAEVTFKLGEVEEGLTYKIHTNLQNEFLQIEGKDCELEGIAESGKTYTVKIKADLSEHYMWLNNKKMFLNEGNGMLYLRFSNGLSVPVTVYVEK